MPVRGAFLLLPGVIQSVPDGKIVKVGMQDSQGWDAR